MFCPANKSPTRVRVVKVFCNPFTGWSDNESYIKRTHNIIPFVFVKPYPLGKMGEVLPDHHPNSQFLFLCVVDQLLLPRMHFLVKFPIRKSSISLAWTLTQFPAPTDKWALLSVGLSVRRNLFARRNRTVPLLRILDCAILCNYFISRLFHLQMPELIRERFLNKSNLAWIWNKRPYGVKSGKRTFRQGGNGKEKTIHREVVVNGTAFV